MAEITDIDKEHLHLNYHTNNTVYTLNISENTYNNRNPLYMEFLIQTEFFGNKISSDVTTENTPYNTINIRFLNCSEEEAQSTVNLDSIKQCKLSINNIHDNSGRVIFLRNNYFNDKGNELDDIILSSYGILEEIFNSTYLSINNINTNYIILSIMILPKLNNFNTDNDNNLNLDSSILFFINGNLLLFYNDYSEYSSIIRLHNFFNDKDNSFSDILNGEKVGATIAVDTDINDTSTSLNKIIVNTEYDKFLFKNLAIMCYHEYDFDKINITKENNSMLSFPIVFCDNNYIQKIFFNSDKVYKFDDNYLNLSDGFKLYKTFEIYQYIDLVDDSYTFNINFDFSIKKYNDNKYNIFEEEFKDYSSLQNLINTTKDETIISIKNTLYSDDFTIIKDNTSSIYNNAIFITYFIFYIKKENNKYKYGYKFVKNPTNYNLLIDDEDIDFEKEIDLDTSFYYYYNILANINDTDSSFRVSDINNLYDNIKFMYSIYDIPKPPLLKSYYYSNDFISKNFFNYYWYYCYEKYNNNSIDFSSPLQDNIVVFPIPIITNFYVEFNINNIGTLNDYIYLGLEGNYTTTNRSDIDTINTFDYSIIYKIKNNNNNQYNIIFELWINKNIISTKEFTKSSLPISFMIFQKYGNNILEITSPEILITKINEEDIININNEIINSETSTDTSNLTNTLNIFIHGNGECNISLNFGPASNINEFQQYIDELLGLETKSNYIIRNKNTIDGNYFYNIKYLQ